MSGYERDTFARHCSVAIRDLGAILTEAYGSIKGGSAGSGNKVEDFEGANRSARPD